MLKKLVFACSLLASLISFSQPETETPPPFYIKTVTLVQNKANVVPIFRLGEAFQLQFDDLHGDEANYYYSITHCDYDWTPSQLSKNEYLAGFDNIRIQDYSNSFNTLQPYSHYRLNIPNKNTLLKVSGNYVLKILNDDREVVFSRKFILYEDLVSIPVQIKTARTFDVLYKKQNIEFAIKPAEPFSFQNPLTNVNVLIMQNGKFDNAITNIRPQYTLANDLIYKYNTETQFWGGNEFLNFENKDIRAANNSVARIDPKGAIYSAHLVPNQPRANLGYTYYPDLNGNYNVQIFNSADNEIEPDYAWIYFTLSAPSYYGNKAIYVNGMFNNYALGEENKMDYNAEKGVYEKAILIKQGFTNYQYVIADENGKIDEENAIDGNFSVTENNYFVLAYYRANNQRYDRIVGQGMANSLNITN